MAIKRWKTSEEIQQKKIVAKATSKEEIIDNKVSEITETAAENENLPVVEPTYNDVMDTELVTESASYHSFYLHNESMNVDTFKTDEVGISYFSRTLHAQMFLVMDTDCAMTMATYLNSDEINKDGDTKVFSDTIEFDEILKKIPDVKVLKALRKMIDKELDSRKKTTRIERD